MCDAMKYKTITHFDWKRGPGCPVSGLRPYTTLNPDRVTCEYCLRLLIKEEKKKKDENRTWNVKMHLNEGGKPLCGQNIIYPNLTVHIGKITCERCKDAHEKILEDGREKRRQDTRAPLSKLKGVKEPSITALFLKMKRRIAYLEKELKRHTDNITEDDF